MDRTGRFILASFAALAVLAGCDIFPEPSYNTATVTLYGNSITITIPPGGATQAEMTAILERQFGDRPGPGPWTVAVKGLDMTDGQALRTLYHSIAGSIPSGGIALDFSGCAGTYLESPGAISEDKVRKRFISITLPPSVEEIRGGTASGTGAFDGFQELTKVTAPRVKSIGDYAFNFCIKLTEIEMPLVEDVGAFAFAYCLELASANFPEAGTVGEGAFNYCPALTLVLLPKASTIGGAAFGMVNASGPIADDTVYTKTLTFTLGDPAPATLGESIFAGITKSKPVVVRCPASAMSDYDSSWMDAFKGEGSSGGGSPNNFIKLSIVPLP